MGFILNPYRFGGGTSYQSEVLADSPFFYWTLDEDSGDSIDLGSIGIDMNPTGTPTQNATGLATAGGSWEFDGSSDYAVTNSSTTALNNRTAGSWECWIDCANANQTGWLVGSNVVSVSSFGEVLFAGTFPSTASKKITFAVLGVSLQRRGYSTVNDIIDGNPHHIVATWEGGAAEADKIKIYVDGVEEATSMTWSNSSFPTQLSGNTRFIGIGRQNDSATRWFDGVIDEVAIYPTTLSASRILAHYNAKEV